MRAGFKVGILFFVAGAFVAFLWHAYWILSLGGAPQLLTAINLSFPSILVRWLGMPGEGSAGGMILLSFVLTTVAKGVVYALIAIGVQPAGWRVEL